MDPNEKFLDFKMIAFFRVMILVLAILMFFAPWTLSIEASSGLDTIGGVWYPEKVRASGFDYLVGCEPVVFSNVEAQVITNALFPILIFASILLSIKPRKDFMIGSISLSLASLIPIYHWIGEIQFLADVYFGEFRITYGVYSIYLIIGLSFIPTILAWRYCDLDESPNSQP